MGKGHFRLVPYRLLPWIDWWLIALTLALVACGIITLWGAISEGAGPGPLRGYAARQCVWAGVGLVVMFGLIAFDYRQLRHVSWALYGVFVLALVGLLLKGEAIKGARSWYDLGFFRLQPIEPGKIILVLVIAKYLAARARTFRGLHHTFKPLGIMALPLVLVLVQPDFGGTMVFMPVIAAMFWVAGLRKWVFVLGLCLGLGAIALGYPHLKPYQQERIKTFLNPEADRKGKGWNIVQAQITLGSGGVVGKGWGMGTQTALNFLPEAHTDFIFPTAGEQFGLVGCGVIVLLLTMLLGRLFQLASRVHDLYGTLIIVGLATTLGTHVVFNIGMCVGVLPVTGLPLPFFSYGGSFMLTCLTMIGLTLSIAARRGL
jgi:rod shape determining protein RodA